MKGQITKKGGKTKSHTFIFASLLFIYFIEAACVIFRFPDKWLLVIIAPPVCFVELSLVFGFCFLITPALRRMGFGATFFLHVVLMTIYLVIFAYSSFQLPMVCREATATGLLCFVLLYLAYMVPIGFDLGLFFVSTRVTLVKGFEIANTIKDLTYKQVFSLEGFLLKPEYTGLIEEHHGTRGGGRFITRDSAFPIVPESWNKEEPIYIFGAYDKGDEQDIQRERHGKTAEEYFNDKFAKSKDVMRVSVSDESNFRRVVNQTCSQYGLKKAPTCLIVKLVNNAEARIKKKKYIMMIIIAVLWMLIFGMFALNMKSGA